MVCFQGYPRKKRCSIAYSLVVLICLSAGIFKPVVGVANNTRHGTGRAELCGEICHRQQQSSESRQYHTDNIVYDSCTYSAYESAYWCGCWRHWSHKKSSWDSSSHQSGLWYGLFLDYYFIVIFIVLLLYLFIYFITLLLMLHCIDGCNGFSH